MVAQTMQSTGQTLGISQDRRQPSLLALYRMEWFKVLRRRMTHVVFVLMAGAMALAPLAGYLTRDRLADGTFDTSNYLMPEALSQMFATLSTLGLVLVAVLAAGMAGSEFSWRTVRTLVGSGTARWKLVAAKLAALLTSVVLLVSFGLLVSIMTSMGIGVFDGHNPLDWLSGETMLDLVLMPSRSIFTLAFLSILAFSVAQTTRSMAAGIATGIGILIIDPVLVMVANSFGDVGESISRFFITPNITVIDELNASNPPVVTDSEVFGPWVAAGLLTLYAVLMIATTITIFNRRDIAVD